MNSMNDLKIAILGMGYVGLPLAIEFGRYRKIICFDINEKRINELKNGVDLTLETSEMELRKTKNLFFTTRTEDIRDANCYIITVPTPITKDKQPDLGPLTSASKNVGKVLKKNDLVIYESTVFPGATEDVCVPILQAYSGLKYNRNFFVGTVQKG